MVDLEPRDRLLVLSLHEAALDWRADPERQTGSYLAIVRLTETISPRRCAMKIHQQPSAHFRAHYGAVIENRQDAKAPATGQLIGNEVERPALIGPSGTRIGARVPRALLRPPRLRTISRSSR
jgi:hypothetical protein